MRKTYSTHIRHVHLKVRDLQTSINFYARYLNLRVVERIDNAYAVLASGDAPEVILEAMGDDVPPTSEFAAGVLHVAFSVDSQDAFTQAFRRLHTDSVPTHAVDHGTGWALYFCDPDGSGLELYWQTGESVKNHQPRIMDVEAILG